VNSSEAIDYKSLDISVGACFYWRYFRMTIEILPSAPSGIFFEDFDKIGFPAQVHQWMIENKNNYQLR